jgi:excisionase family DNA binding protein
MAEIDPARVLLTKEEVATLLNCSVKTVQRHVAAKKLKCVVLGWKTRRFRPADVDRCVAKLAGDQTYAY